MALAARPRQARDAPEPDAAPELLLRCEEKVLVERIGSDTDLHPFAATGDDGERRYPRIGHPHVVLELRHVLFGCRCLRERPWQHELGLEHGSCVLDNAVQRAARKRITGCSTRRCTAVTTRPVLRSYHCRLRASVATPSWTMRLPERSSGSASPRFSPQRRTRAASSVPIMMRASDPPMKPRRCINTVWLISTDLYIDLLLKYIFYMKSSQLIFYGIERFH